MKLLQILLLMVSSIILEAQSTDTPLLNEAYVATKTKPFTLTDRGLAGPGAQGIEKAIQQSQFTILGEYHGSPQISKFTKGIIPYLADADYQHFACEVGPHSARKLSDLASPPAQTLKQLTAFNRKYDLAELDDVPLPFFEFQSDAAFLSAIKQQKMDIWGLDQEYFSAAFFLYDELLSLTNYKPNFQEIKILKEAAVKVTNDWMVRDYESEKWLYIFGEILEEPAMKAFFGVFNESDSLALRIIEDLKVSWDIYDRYQGGASHQDRLNYIRANFSREYQRASQQETMPKVFVKIGGRHAPRNPIGGPDVGSLIQELVEKNGTQSTHLSMISRYYKVDGQLTDHLKTDPRGYKRYELFLAAAKPDQGLVIDLRSIREDIASGRIKYPQDPNRKYWKTLIENFDFQVVLPADYPATPAK